MEPTKTATIDEHFAIAAAIEAKDKQAARHAMRQHIVLAAKRLQKVMSMPGRRDPQGASRRDGTERAPYTQTEDAIGDRARHPLTGRPGCRERRLDGPSGGALIPRVTALHGACAPRVFR